MKRAKESKQSINNIRLNYAMLKYIRLMISNLLLSFNLLKNHI